MKFPIVKKGQQGRWPQAIALFLSPIFIVLCMRWLWFEPFVIPSESMVPTLLVRDHIIVSKFSYGIKVPFFDAWLFRWGGPERGDLMVFRSPENRDVFFIKRVVGLPGDTVYYQAAQLTVNGRPWILEPIGEGVYSDQNNYKYFTETIHIGGDNYAYEHQIRMYAQGPHADQNGKTLTVPKNSYFVVGDNRDQSNDSRFWGFVPEKLIVGRASFIWLSCEKTLDDAPMLCDPTRLRVDRIFKGLQK